MVMKKISGFTLIELMIVLAIFTIIVGMAVPFLKTWVLQGHIKLATNELVSALYVARSAAIKDSAFGCVCPSSDMNNAVPTCRGDGNWETGWIAFSDALGNCVYEPGADVLLKIWDGSIANDPNFTIRNDNTSITAVNYVRFNSRGLPVRTNGSAQQGSFKICDERGVRTYADGTSDARAVQLSPSGRARYSDDAGQIVNCSTP